MTVRALRSTAQRIQLLAAEAAGLGVELERLVAAVAPWLLELPGVGPISAAQVLVSWSYAGRLRSEAAFAALAGANPIPASSRQVTRHRLNRSGDRQLNRALHTIVVARLRDDPETRAYATRRRAEGKSARDFRGASSGRSPDSCSNCWNATIGRGWGCSSWRKASLATRSFRRLFCTWIGLSSRRGHHPPRDGPGCARSRAAACPRVAGCLSRADARRLS